MNEQAKPDTTRGDEPGSKPQQGSPGQQPQKPMGQPDKSDPNRDANKERDQDRNMENPNRTP